MEWEYSICLLKYDSKSLDKILYQLPKPHPEKGKHSKEHGKEKQRPLHHPNKTKQTQKN